MKRFVDLRLRSIRNWTTAADTTTHLTGDVEFDIRARATTPLIRTRWRFGCVYSQDGST
jgi:hypothetical protein